jgi:hypothetical protein
MDIIRFIEEKKPFVFAKFGDGEYYATIQTCGGNCDGTPFTPDLKSGTGGASDVFAIGTITTPKSVVLKF